MVYIISVDLVNNNPHLHYTRYDVGCYKCQRNGGLRHMYVIGHTNKYNIAGNRYTD